MDAAETSLGLHVLLEYILYSYSISNDGGFVLSNLSSNTFGEAGRIEFRVTQEPIGLFTLLSIRYPLTFELEPASGDQLTKIFLEQLSDDTEFNVGAGTAPNRRPAASEFT